MYVSDLNGGRPIEFTTMIEPCPPDCGGEEYDEIEYVALCPFCHTPLEERIGRPKYCPECGTKLYWEVKWPVFKEENDE